MIYKSLHEWSPDCISRNCLGANHLTSEGGGGGWVILKKNILQVHVRKKKFPAQDYCPKKIHARTVGWKKNSGKMFPGLTHRTLSADC